MWLCFLEVAQPYALTTNPVDVATDVVFRAYVYFFRGKPQLQEMLVSNPPPVEPEAESVPGSTRGSAARPASARDDAWWKMRRLLPQKSLTIDTKHIQTWPYLKRTTFSKPSFWVSMLVFAGVYVRHVRDTADGKNPASQLRL